MEAYEGLISFLNDLDRLRGCANLCFFSKSVRKKLCYFSPHVRCPGEAFEIKSEFETYTYIPGKRVTSSAETEIFGTWDATDIAKRRVKYHPFCHCLSRFFTMDDNLHPLHSASVVYSEH